MGWQEDNNRLQQKEDLIDGIKTLIGYEPPGVRVLLRVLSHPEMVSEVRRYFESLDNTQRCTNYEPPWNCAREAEARYENVEHGWLGGNITIGQTQWWCEPCKRRVLGED